MKKFLTLSFAALLCAQSAAAQQQSAKPTQKKTGAPNVEQKPAQTRERATPQPVGLTEYGIEIGPDPRLVVMMAALDAAGWDPTPAGERPSVFRELVRKDQAALDPILRKRMQDFYERNRLRGDSVTPAEQAARYVSLTYTLSQPPAFEAPPRSDDLPTGVLDVLDFVPLLREFYKQSGMDSRLGAYIQMHRAASDELRAPTIDMARAVLSYFNTRPETTITERTVSTDPAQAAKKKKDEKKVVVYHEHERHFRRDVDPVEIHKAIAALGMFNVTNRYTFGAIFQRDMGKAGDVGRRRDIVADMIVSYLTCKQNEEEK